VAKRDRTAWQGSTPPSLIQQRMDIDRGRTRSLTMIWFGAALVLLGTVRLLGSSTEVLAFLQTAVAIVLVGAGAFRLKRTNQELAAFEAEHGKDAGKQDPIR
jgi:Flp pilus assembly protein TadB